jgi:hypothetical protein
MNKTGLFIVSLMLLPLVAQDKSSVRQPNHPKKAYCDPVVNKLYWPLEKPVYIRLAESADNNASSFPLLADNDSTGIKSGIRLDISGSQFIRWYNYLTRDSVKLRFFADGEPPECSIVLTGEKTKARPTDAQGNDEQKQVIVQQTGVCYSRSVAASFSARDHLSGIGGIYVSVNNAAWEPAASDIVFNKENRYRVGYYAVDRVGNAGTPRFQDFSIDATPPVTSLVFNGRVDEKDTIFSRSQAIAFSGVDTISGIQEIMYRFDGDKKFSTFKNPVSLKALKDGAHAVSFYSVDNAGNEEKAKSRSFVIDDTPPASLVSFEGDRIAANDGQDYISPRTIVKITATDDKSGIGKIEYAIEDAEFVTYTSPFRFSPQLKKCVLEVRVTDKAGNCSPKHRVTVKMDAQPPKSGYAVSGPLVQKNGVLYITSDSRITLSAKDEASGVSALKYRIDDAAEASYTQPFAIASEGRHLFHYLSLDRVNNSEDTQAVVMVVDNTPPRIVETFSIQTSPADTANKKVPRFPAGTALFLAATDASGVDGIWYTVNGKRETKYNGDLQFNDAGKYSVVIRAKDILGKVGEKTVEFEIGN